MSLDKFLPRPTASAAIEERCADPACRKIIKSIKYTLTVRGKEAVYCQNCAKRILRPRESVDEL